MKVAYRECYRDPQTFADRIYLGEKVFAIADGMGRGPGAVVAAQTAVEVLANKRWEKTVDGIKKLLGEVNREVMSATARLGDRQVSGTTLSLLCILEKSFILGHVGDSRIYLLRDGKIKQLTEDQVQYSGNKKIVNTLGINWNPEVFVEEGELRKGDIFLLISDGFAEVLSGELLTKLITEDVEESARRLYDEYTAHKRNQDLSFIIIKND